ncbi:hypothetical protein [Flavobacterium sp. HNIBRBA15423]|uniref:hypothetical protein n=1 Tax=Flavobacterium sp. HNIBRBA15423 TaxID=3458683 RepID=UPI0040441E35
MEFEKCKSELSKIKSQYTNENGNYKLLTHKDAKFKLQILDILIVENPKIKDDYVISFETKHLYTLEEKPISLDVVNLYYI